MRGPGFFSAEEKAAHGPILFGMTVDFYKKHDKIKSYTKGARLSHIPLFTEG